MTWRRVLAVTVSCSKDTILESEKRDTWLTCCACAMIVDFDSFQKVLNRPGGFRDPGEPEEYCRGFQVFDKDMTGFIGVGQLRYSTSLSILGYIVFGTIRVLTEACSLDEPWRENE